MSPTNITVNDFFKPVTFEQDISEEDYKKLIPLIEFAKGLSEITYQSVYLIDYYKRSFVYVSENPIFLCGYTARQVLRYGYLFYLLNVPKTDLELLLTINNAGFSFFNALPAEDRLKYAISYDFHLKQPKGNLMLVNQKLKPLLLDKYHHPWIALCLVSISPRLEAGNVWFKSSELKKYYEFDLGKKLWMETKTVELNKREKEVLILSAQGLTMLQIASRLSIAIDTVKFHKRSIFHKLSVKSISEAIAASIDLALL